MTDAAAPGPVAAATPRATLLVRDDDPRNAEGLLRNRRLDRNFLEIPTEGVGSSDDAVRFGLPSFESARLTVPAEGLHIVVKLRYWL